MSTWWRTRPVAERACYLIAAVLFASGLVHLGVLVVGGGTWSGPLSFRKPTTFGLSFGLTLATVTWVLALLPLRARMHRILLGVFAAACVVEVLLISVQAWRGQPSHFGMTGSGAGLAAAAAASGGAAIVVTMVVAAASTLRPMPSTAPSMRLALRAGFASLLVAIGLGVVMLARGMVLSRGFGDVDGAFAFTAEIKPAHGATMHGLLVLPALAWILSYTDRPEAFRLAVMRGAVAGYALMAGVVILDVVLGVDPLAPASVALIGVGVLVLAAAGVVALRAALARWNTRRPTGVPM